MSTTGDDLQLFARRTVMLAPVLDHEVATRVAAELMTLDALGNERIELWINCAGGTFDAALAVIDVIDLLGVALHTTCLSRADGPAVGVLAVGDHRAIAPHGHVRFDAPYESVAGRVADVVRTADDLRRRRVQFSDRLAQACGQSTEWIDDAFRARRTLEPVDALRFGLVDEVAVPRRAALVPFRGSSRG